MGIYLCEKHGRQGIRNVCPHLGEAVRNGLTVPAHNVFPIVLLEDLEGASLDFYYCFDCVERLHLPLTGGQLELPPNDEAADKMLEQLKPGDSLCAGCFNEAIGKEVIRWDASNNADND